MQTVHRPEVEAAKEKRPVAAPVNRGSLIARGAALLVLAFFLWFVHSLQGITFDTVFLAIFWTFLVCFVVKSFIAGFHDSRQA